MAINRDPLILVGGIASASTAARLRAAAPNCSLILATAPSLAQATGAGPTCLDVTSYLVNLEMGPELRRAVEEAATLPRSSPPQRGLVLVHEYQLRDEDFVELLRRLNFAAIVINTHSCYDYDPSWLVANLESDAERVDVVYFAVDLFTCVKSSWETFLTTGDEDEFQVADLEQLCKEFRILLSANFTPENIYEIASFPGARGILMTCDELKPIMPPDRNSVTVDAAVELLAVLAAACK